MVIVLNLWMMLLSQTQGQNNKPVNPRQQQINKPENQKEASILLKEKKALEILALFKVV